MNHARKKVSLFLLALPLLIGALSGWLSREGMREFAQLRQSALTPPPWAFPVVWTILYILMGISASRIWSSRHPGRGDALFLFAVQLFINFWWSIFFFAWQLRLYAFFWLLLLLAVAAAMTLSFRRIDPTAAVLNIPYLLWLVLAAWLNLSAYLLNK